MNVCSKHLTPISQYSYNVAVQQFNKSQNNNFNSKWTE